MKTNRTHSKGGQKKAVSQGKTTPPQPAVPSSAFLRLIRHRNKRGVEIRIGAAALECVHKAGLSLTDLQPALRKLGRKVPKGWRLEVDFEQLITDYISHRIAPALEPIVASLGLTREEAIAWQLCAQWESKDAKAMARAGVLCMMNGTLDEMTPPGLNRPPGPGCPKPEPRAVAWAGRFYPQLKALHPKGGWR